MRLCARFVAVWPLFFVLSPVSAFTADGVPEVFLPDRVGGVLLTGPLERKAFHFAPPKVRECERTEVVKMVVFRCKASGGQLLLEGGPPTNPGPTLDFTGVTVFYKPQKNGGVLREYHFSGTWTETVAAAVRTTPMKWSLWRSSDRAPAYHGYLELVDWGYSVRLLAAVP